MVVTKQSISTPTHSMKPTWLRTGVGETRSAPKAKNMTMPAAEMIVPACKERARAVSCASLARARRGGADGEAAATALRERLGE